MSMSYSGKSPTKKQADYHDLLCRSVGCIACHKDGVFNDWVSIHHVIGRSRPDAQWMVLPLCAAHHQGVQGMDKTVKAVHINKSAFERQYGLQSELIIECAEILNKQGYSVPAKILEIGGIA